MSYDLRVASYLEPSQRHVDEFIAQHPDLVVEGGLAGEKTAILVKQQTATGEEPLFTVDGPISATENELGTSLGQAVPGARWTTLLSVPAIGGEHGIGVAEALARYFAEQCWGAIYDLQEDAIL